ncbi:MAG: acyltransferase family protein [Buchananella hordeovulneris]|nr:acyltransferase family protein [Buchananella hordeovulneris]
MQGLDGLRAAAVVLVLGYHLFPLWVPAGRVGVDFFFVISGFLITSLLLLEIWDKGRVDMVAFTKRRMRRLFPALVTVVLVISGVAAFAGVPDMLLNIRRQVTSSLLFVSNWADIWAGASYFERGLPQLFTNIWSLSVEAQFYLIWPLLLGAGIWITRRLFARPAAGQALLAIWAVVLAAGSIWWGEYLRSAGADPSRVYLGTDTHAFGLMLGAALAVVHGKALSPALPRPNPSSAYRAWIWVRGLTGWGAGLLVGAVARTVPLPGLAGLPDAAHSMLPLIYASVLAVLVLQSLTPEVVAVPGPGRWLARVLELRPLVWIGERSYSIYLWHWPVLIISYYTLRHVNKYGRLWGVAALSVVLAALSYRFIETPLRRGGLAALKQLWATKWALRLPAVGLAVVMVTATGVALAHQPAMSSVEIAIVEAEKAQGQYRSQTRSEAAAAPGLVDGEGVTIIGDSVTVLSAEALADALPGVYVDAQKSRAARQSLSLLEAADAAVGKRPLVVVALATNDSAEVDDFESLVAYLGPERKLLLLTGAAPEANSWVYKANAAVWQVAAAHPGQVRVADWEEAVEGKPELFSVDMIHPLAPGQALYAQLVAQELAALAGETGN